MRKRFTDFVLALACGVGLTSSSNASGAPPTGGPARYALKRTLRVGGEGGWDYLTVDPLAHRLYIPRATHVMVADEASGKVLGDIPGTSGVHGVALAPEFNRGFTSNGKANTVTVFDLKTLAAVETLKVGQNPDAILYDPRGKLVLVLNGRSGEVSAIPADPARHGTVESTKVGGKLEGGVTDGKGQLYVNVEDKGEVVRLAIKEGESGSTTGGMLSVISRWPLAPGEEPTGLAMDVKNHRLFAGCHNKMMVVVDSESGKVLATPPIGAGVDGCAFDHETGLAFASCGDGTLSIVKETSPGKFEVVQTVATKQGAKTLVLDPKTHAVYLPTADFEAGKAEGKRRATKPNSFQVLVVAPE
jgi:DNA-binding beta-propeller fold protein YncE